MNKPIFATKIVEHIRGLNPPGRFLKQDPKTKLWYDIGNKKALEKTRQALREGAPDLAKHIQEGSVIMDVVRTRLVWKTTVYQSAESHVLIKSAHYCFTTACFGTNDF